MNPQFRCLSLGKSRALDILQCRPLLSRGVPHGFTLRRRHWSDRPAASFGRRDRANDEHRELAYGFGLRGMVFMRQVHGREVRAVSTPPKKPPECDALVSREPGLGLLVQSADCVPILFWDSGRHAAAAVHAGWRGTVKGVAQAAVAEMARRYGSEVADLNVAIGPAIGGCCYEVGEDVVDAFAAAHSDETDLFQPGPRGRPHLDLVLANRKQLQSMGIPEEQIYAASLCTACHVDRLYSYRKEGKGVGRLMGVISAPLERGPLSL